MSQVKLSVEELRDVINKLSKVVQESDKLDFIKAYRESNQVIIMYNEEHKLNKYDDKIKEILDSPFISRRIAYNLAVYLKCKELFTNYNKYDPINEAFKIISKKANVSIQSIQDKAYRQIELDSQSYKRYIIEALNGDTTKIRNTLLGKVGRNTSDYDEKVINEVIK